MSDGETTSEARDEHEEIEALFSEYYEGDLGDADRARVAEHLEGCERCKSAYEELERALEAVSGLGKVDAPADFEKQVESTIEQRSAGRFFGGRKLTDRLPLTIIALVAIAISMALYLWLRSSETGSLKRNPGGDQEKPVKPEVRDVLPQP